MCLRVYLKYLVESRDTANHKSVLCRYNKDQLRLNEIRIFQFLLYKWP